MIAKIPDEILLEIFDLYRRSFEHHPNYERDWNNKNGWFKLAHVCHNWRCIVFASSTRLQVRLFFTDRTPTRAAVLSGLPPLPIIVAYHDVSVPWTVGRLGSENRLISALRYPDRVCQIAMEITYSNRNTITKALDCAFPSLEALEIHNPGVPGFSFPPTFLMTTAKSLRRLKIPGASLTSLTTLLSATTALVDLTLGVNTVFSPPQGVLFPSLQDLLQPNPSPQGISLASLLQNLSRLRHLDVSVHSTQYTRAISPVKTTDVVLLAELNHFRIQGHTTEVEELVAGLATPSLQNLHVTLNCGNSAFHIPRLSVIIRNMGMVFHTAQIRVSITTSIFSLLPNSDFIDDPPFNILVHGQSAIAQICSEISAMLDTVEDLFITIFTSVFPDLGPGNIAPFRGFFEQLHNVKILRVQHGLETDVANLLREYNGQPTMNHPVPVPDGVDLDAAIPSDLPTNPSRFNVGIFPSLEGIEVHQGFPGTKIPESEHASDLEPFEELVTAWQQAGRSVKVYCKTDQE